MHARASYDSRNDTGGGHYGQGLKAVFQTMQAMMAHHGVPSAPLPPPQPPAASTSALFPQSVPQTAPPATAPVSRCYDLDPIFHFPHD